MTLAFDTPSAWWLLAIVPVAWLLASNRVLAQRTHHGLPHVAVRSLLLATLVAALTQPVLSWPSSRTAVVYLVDVSDSIASSAWAHAADVIDRLTTGARPDDSRILLFAGGTTAISDTAALRTMAAQRSVPDDVSREVRPAGTDLEQALLAAQAEIEPTASGRIVLLSDGRQTAGDSDRATRRLAAARVPVFVEPASVKNLGDTWIDDVRVPRMPVANTPAALDVIIGSQASAAVEVSVREGGRTVASRRATVPAGTSTVSLDVPVTTAGAHLMEAAIRTDRDVLKENDTFTREVMVAPPVRVLYVQAESGDAAPAPAALAHAGMTVTVARPGELPTQPGPLGRFDVVVLNNVARALLSPGAMAALGSWVQDSGGGLLFAGGDAVVGESADQTRAGYRHSDLEGILPVTFDRDDEPEVALVIVLDRSWSMFGAAMDLSKAAAEAAANTLAPAQMVGVLSFNDNAEWNVPLARVRDNRNTLHDAIARITASGPTAIYPALEYAYDALAAVRARAKHVILLSDGQTAPRDFEGLVGKMKHARMTVSSVALGPEADVTLLRNLAVWGGGRSYVVENASQIPEIFVKEARNASNPSGEDDSSIRPVARQGAYFGSLGLNVPTLSGRNVVTRKSQSIELLGTSRGDPLLSIWHAGLGRTAMFAADLQGRWTKDWIAWPGFGAALAAIVRSLATPRAPLARLDVAPDERRGSSGLRITLAEHDETGRPRDLLNPVVEIRREDQRATLPLIQVSPGHYEAQVLSPTTAPLFLSVTGPSPGDPMERIHTTDPAAEYRFGPPDEQRLATIAAETGGSVRPTVDDLRRARLASGVTRYAITPWCLALALVLWPLDVALRRLWR
ncbi:MAG: VWA domain-containing protein [Acidobacteriota bacterium]